MCKEEKLQTITKYYIIYHFELGKLHHLLLLLLLTKLININPKYYSNNFALIKLELFRI